MALHTALCDLLGIRVPLFNAPMTPQAGGELARAVSAAGAFGMLGFDEDEGAESIARQAEIVRAGGSPFGIGLAAWVLERRPELLDVAIALRPALVNVSFGDPAPYVARLHAAGILVGAQVQNSRWAQTAIDAGTDVIVAQGTEAGGHTGAVGTLPLLQLVLELTSKPVLAAGGIANGRGFAAVLAAGAAGAWIGTPFLMARESRTSPAAQTRIIESDETQTMLTHVYDRAQGKPWPDEFRGRVLRNAFVERWDEREDEMLATPAAVQEFQDAKRAGDFSRANIYAGQSVGALHAVESAAEIVTRFETQAVSCLEAAQQILR